MKVELWILAPSNGIEKVESSPNRVFESAIRCHEAQVVGPYQKIMMRMMMILYRILAASFLNFFCITIKR